MKNALFATLIAATVLSAPMLLAQDTSAPATTGTMAMDKQMNQMNANMAKMQQQMAKIQATTDPKVRQNLMQEHMRTMQENMKAMREMGGPMMMGSGKHGGMAMGSNKDGLSTGDMMQRHQMMENRMDMMEMMMEQMMQHNQALDMKPAK